MTTNRKKTPMQLFREAFLELQRKEAMYDGLKRKDGPRGEKLTSEIEELRIMIPKLEAVKDEDEPLSDGCKTHLSQVYAYQKYGKWSLSRDIGSKYTDKGKEVEDNSIELVSKLEGIYFDKNPDRIENDWFTGIPDFYEGDNIMKADKIHDVKSPWDIESFLNHVGKPLSLNYYWQMQGYMDLTGAKVAEVHFCLVNQPMYLIKKEMDRYLESKKIIDTTSREAMLLELDVWNNLTFDDIPESDRRIKFIIERNDDDIKMAHHRVEKCREYLMEFEKLHINYDYNVTSKKVNLDEPISA